MANDEKSRNIDNRTAFHSYHEASSIMKEELEETEEALEQLNQTYQTLWCMVKQDDHYDKTDFNKQLERICFDCKQVALEAIHTYSVALKTMEQSKTWRKETEV